MWPNTTSLSSTNVVSLILIWTILYNFVLTHVWIPFSQFYLYVWKKNYVFLKPLNNVYGDMKKVNATEKRLYKNTTKHYET